MKAGEDMTNDVIRVRLFRFDPSRDVRPFYESYEVPYTGKLMRILDVLRYLEEELGVDFAFRYTCGFRRCGSCGLTVNGEPRLACWDPAEKEMTIEPLKGFPVIRDLVVDRGVFENRLRNLIPFLMRAKPVEKFEKIKHRDTKYGEDTGADMALVHELREKCITCYICLSACPLTEVAWKGYPGPSAIVQFAKFMFDPRDSLDRVTIALSEGVYDCTTCRKCVDVCPTDLAIPELVTERIRHIINRGGLGPLPEHLEFGKNAVDTGRVIRKREKTFLELVPEEAPAK